MYIFEAHYTKLVNQKKKRGVENEISYQQK